ncbi:hypothetical protein [Aporhodopirellula aestuarii]|uniref:Secreted protein n=1 Tax=Aporhodopirellula aestuarii TaxID=2950107 RepID=A0ABT0U6V4_9BACT|nr:hypothetical protein [Aporhodopirellula aestuarii]MCM2372542.1 hypothetical protein [Aporhodopirellula aestuarii]
MNVLIRRLFFCSFAAGLILNVFINTVAAQPPTDPRYGSPYGSAYDYNHNFGRFGYGYGAYRSGHASTAEEGMARGIADVIRSRGQAALSYSQAATEAERARRAYLENRNFAIKSYVENRAIRDELRKKQSDERKEKLAAYIKSREYRPLSSSEFYEPTGEISWPIALQHPHDAKGRQEIEELFAARAEKGSLPAEDYIRLNKLLNSWVYHVEDHQADFSVNEVDTAVRFLRRLEKLIKEDYQ